MCSNLSFATQGNRQNQATMHRSAQIRAGPAQAPRRCRADAAQPRAGPAQSPRTGMSRKRRIKPTMHMANNKDRESSTADLTCGQEALNFAVACHILQLWPSTAQAPRRWATFKQIASISIEEVAFLALCNEIVNADSSTSQNSTSQTAPGLRRSERARTVVPRSDTVTACPAAAQVQHWCPATDAKP
jgi:hypothetical protein